MVAHSVFLSLQQQKNWSHSQNWSRATNNSRNDNTLNSLPRAPELRCVFPFWIILLYDLVWFGFGYARSRSTKQDFRSIDSWLAKYPFFFPPAYSSQQNSIRWIKLRATFCIHTLDYTQLKRKNFAIAFMCFVCCLHRQEYILCHSSAWL